MLPQSYFCRLTQAMGVKTDQRTGERRRGIRIPATFRPDVFPVEAGVLHAPHRVRARDISSHGISLLVPRALVRVHTIAMSVTPRGAEEAFGMTCFLRRTHKVDTTWTLAGYTFEQLLRPGQAFAAETDLALFDLIDVTGPHPAEDPLAAMPPPSSAINMMEFAPRANAVN